MQNENNKTFVRITNRDIYEANKTTYDAVQRLRGEVGQLKVTMNFGAVILTGAVVLLLAHLTGIKL